jgi:hypothetical protein
MQNRISRSLLSYIGVCVIVWIGITQCVEVSEVMPDNAILLVDDQKKLYHSPIHFREDKIDRPVDLREVRAAEARQQKYDPDPTCRDREYFSYERGSLLRAKLSDWFGLASPRWNDDGSWNW